MPTVVQFRRGTTAQNNNFLGANGEISVDTTLNVLRVADSVTLGGFALVGQNCVQTIANKTYTGTSLSVTGNVTGSYIIGNGSQLTGLPAGYTNANLASLGSNVILTTGNITGGNLDTSGTATIGGFTISGNTITSSGSTITIDPNTTGGVDGLVIIQGNLQVNGNTTTINSNVISTNDLTVNYANNATSSSQANGAGIEVGPIGSPFLTFLYNSTSNVWTSSGGISAVGTVTAASTVGGVIAGSSVSVTGTQTAASTVGGVITGSSVSVTGTINGTTLTGTSLTVSTGNITGGNLILSGAIEDSGQLDIRTTASNGNIVLTPNGTGNVNTGSNIMPTANATANIGSATLSFNTIFAKATSAQYADLAEMYCADDLYAPGTVLDFGGTEEVTATTQSHSTQVAGIVSTNPSYLMNSTLDCVNAIAVALVGRVPCQVVGTIAKGDRLVASSISGVATCLDMAQYQPGCIIGKALEAYNSETVGTIEVAVGRV
jgi:hypothetical protein